MNDSLRNGIWILFAAVLMPAWVQPLPEQTQQIAVWADLGQFARFSWHRLQDPSSTTDANSPDERLKAVVWSAFEKTHAGYSSDEVILQDELQTAFQSECVRQSSEFDAFQFNWTLLNLRKQGKLSQIKTTRRTNRDLSSVRHLAEIVARSLQDAEKESIDRILCNPETRQKFDRLAQTIAPDVEAYAVRRAAFQLRKARRLRPELITRIADWGRVVTTYSAAELADHLEQLPEQPGIYLFSDSQGYLYIGESDNLRRRLTAHLDASDRKTLAHYFQQQGLEKITVEVHTFAKDSRIHELAVRRAYESELIRSRHPRFNIRP